MNSPRGNRRKIDLIAMYPARKGLADGTLGECITAGTEL
jgi:hypothetical protein